MREGAGFLGLVVLFQFGGEVHRIADHGIFQAAPFADDAEDAQASGVVAGFLVRGDDLRGARGFFAGGEPASAPGAAATSASCSPIAAESLGASPFADRRPPRRRAED